MDAVGQVDAVVEATEKSRTACLEELVRALVRTFADVRDVTPTEEMTVDLGPARDTDLVARVLGDVCFLLDIRGLVVVDLEFDEDSVDGDIYGTLFVAPAAAARPLGAGPKEVDRSQITFERCGDVWHGRAVVY